MEENSYKKLVRLFEKSDLPKKKIDEAGKTLDEASHRNEIIRKKLKGVEEIEAAEEAAEEAPAESTEDILKDIRELLKAEK